MEQVHTDWWWEEADVSSYNVKHLPGEETHVEWLLSFKGFEELSDLFFFLLAGRATMQSRFRKMYSSSASDPTVLM